MTQTATASGRRLANQILDVIRDAKFEPGHHLREQQLADLLGVSRTPVRSALKLLSELGIIEARRNQGFFLVKSFNELHQINIDIPVSSDQDLYEQLVRDRIAGKLPDSLTQIEIAQRYDVDRSVMARTLLRLSEDGLIARNKGQGWSFLPTLNTDVALSNGYGFRLMIEPAALLSPAFRAERSALKRLRLQHIYLISHPDILAVDGRQIFDTDASFHEMLAEFSGNIFVLQAIQQQNRLRRLLEFGSYTNKQRVREWCEEHVAIIDAVLDKRMDAAAEMMRSHLQSAYQMVLNKVGKASQ
ncbi:DNA-binding GntR family transcriptional regulator [Gibbsiella quercinecans]|uniref:Transcriptional regulator n=4 Tax=Gibbsiella TaxID=929812 RepID=A0A250B7B2_9GAMM|nr:GntR family transcriptional regulator [Gibbsiella quercinecans]ATA22120.1 transcriptional regulator [Gibbsiella quercinecans]RLM04519.1 transcriptional regulator [Gibbsiella quercinecans]RLM09312.1 transcriptional regulator [Gibbsiella quercinecans]RLM16642.1 transcriptional regulator [Gibbsiella quercinecans]TCT88019.1 DNA-binding GntR family transcriptional regulator [Gibbsiella quercinecans]